MSQASSVMQINLTYCPKENWTASAPTVYPGFQLAIVWSTPYGLHDHQPPHSPHF